MKKSRKERKAKLNKQERVLYGQKTQYWPVEMQPFLVAAACVKVVLKNSEKANARLDYEQLEKELDQVDKGAWQEFKQKVRPYITTKDSQRGHNQLFECFNEVKGYLYLETEGCGNIHFIRESNITHPDLRACYGSSIVLLEVKTCNKSDAENEWIKANSQFGSMQVKNAIQGLGDPLKQKIAEKISEAKRQLLNYASDGVKRRIVYLVISLDVLLALDPRNLNDLAAYIQT